MHNLTNSSIKFHYRDDFLLNGSIDNLRTNDIKKILENYPKDVDYNLLFIDNYCKSLLDNLNPFINDELLLEDIKLTFEIIKSKVSSQKFRITDYYMLAEYEVLYRTANAKFENLIGAGVEREVAISAIRSGISLLKRNVKTDSSEKSEIELDNGTMIKEKTCINGFDFLIIVDNQKLFGKRKVKDFNNRYSIMFGEVKATSVTDHRHAPKFVRKTPVYQSADMITKYLTIYKHLNNYLRNNPDTTLNDFTILYNDLFSYYLKSINSARMSQISYRLSCYATPYYLFTKTISNIPILLPIDPKQIANTKIRYEFASASTMFPLGIVDDDFNLNNTTFEQYNPSLWPSFVYIHNGIEVRDKVTFEIRRKIARLGLKNFQIEQLQLPFDVSKKIKDGLTLIVNSHEEFNGKGKLNIFHIDLPSKYSELSIIEKQRINEFERTTDGIILVNKTSNRKRARKLLFYDSLRNLNFKLPIEMKNEILFLQIQGKYIFQSSGGRISRLFYWLERSVSGYTTLDYYDEFSFPTKMIFIFGIGIKQVYIKNKYSIGRDIALCHISEFDGLPFRVIRPFEKLHEVKRKRRNYIRKSKIKSRAASGSPPAMAIIRFKNNFDIVENKSNHKILWSKAVKKMNILAGYFGGRGKQFSPKYFHNRSETVNSFTDWLNQNNYPNSWYERLKLIFDMKLTNESKMIN